MNYPGPTPAYEMAVVVLLNSGLHVRCCSHCTFWTTDRPSLRKHIRDEHPTLPQYRRRPKEGWYDQSTGNG